MKLEKAPEVLNDLLCWQEIKPYPDVKDAIKLGIEALKLIVRKRPTLFSLRHPLLPGETKD